MAEEGSYSPLASSGEEEVKDAVAEAVEAFQRGSVASTAPSSPAETSGEDDDKDVVWPAALSTPEEAFELNDEFWFGGMDAGSYYASLAQGLLVEPPAAGVWWEDGDLAGSDMALWSY
ncbi:hypothetical protein ABZP36_036131 [Zizania latifolia]